MGWCAPPHAPCLKELRRAAWEAGRGRRQWHRHLKHILFYITSGGEQIYAADVLATTTTTTR